MKNRLLNVFFQGVTLVTRFGLIFSLAKYLPPFEMGYYGLFVAAVGYSIYFVGLDFYTYLTREAIQTPKQKIGVLLKGQAFLSSLLYGIFTPIALFFINQNSGWPNYLIWWFIPILFVEHVNQEMGRLLVTLSEQVAASMILFVRQGSWALFVIFVMFFKPSSRTLELPIMAWFISGVFAAFFAITKLKQMGIRGWQDKPNWRWIKRGIAVSIAFLFATLALRGIQTFDRYLLESIGGIEIVGAYVLFIGISGSLLAFLDSGIFSFAYPILIDFSQKGEWVSVRKKIKQMLWFTIAFSFLFVVISLALMPHLLRWINKDIYTSSINFYYWILLATIINAISLIPHYALYAAGRDRAIIFSHVLALFVFIGAVLLLKSNSLALAVPQGGVVAFLFILIFKTMAYKILSQSQMVPAV